jgi:aryl-phospho-beta-D-glucosidase BglC (GH1 family)
VSQNVKCKIKNSTFKNLVLTQKETRAKVKKNLFDAIRTPLCIEQTLQQNNQPLQTDQPMINIQHFPLRH